MGAPQEPPFPPNPPPPLPGPGGMGFLGLFLIGAIGGAAISAAAWIGAWKILVAGGGETLLFLVPGLKLAAAIPLLYFRRWRGLGAGIMVSIALGFLIFFGNCMVRIQL